ncbi:bifunctional phosphoribosylaminoimidazolecarboxamide formyltransferase/IMP cyclohydrolase [bacterium]|nr:bifunctional phosphoribosylaminoimidazolecarboxamide formyltransferase/IMP cyclohydrolase [bacterium]
MKRRAFVSVYDKNGIEDFVRNLIDKFGYEIVAAGDTYNTLTNAGIEVVNVAEFTAPPSLLSNDYNSLNERVLAGILANSYDAKELNQLESFAIKEFDTVVINLRPFKDIERKTSDVNEMINQIDIVGVTLLRAAAKNYKNVTVICDKQDYYLAMNANDFGRLKLAAKVFNMISDYDRAICSAVLTETGENSYKSFSLEKINDLPHGENHGQKAAVYNSSVMIDYKIENENELSYNDILNLTEAINITSEFYDVPAVAIVRHTKPCGVAIGKSIYEAYTKAFDCDPMSTYFGTVAFSQKVDSDTAKHLSSMAVEVIAAPEFDEDAMEILKEDSSLKIITLKTPLKEYRQLQMEEFTVTPFGVLIQDKNNSELKKDMFKVVTKEKPTAQQIEDAVFGWKVAKYAKTNAAIVVKNLKAVSIGQGYTNTLTAIESVLNQAADMAKDAVLVSDCAIPAEDCIYAAIQNRISLIIQPGGVPKDPQIIEMADKYGITMIMTGIKNYTH